MGEFEYVKSRFRDIKAEDHFNRIIAIAAKDMMFRKLSKALKGPLADVNASEYTLCLDGERSSSVLNYENKLLVLGTGLAIHDLEFAFLHEMRHLHQQNTKTTINKRRKGVPFITWTPTGETHALSMQFKNEKDFISYLMLPWEIDANQFAYANSSIRLANSTTFQPILDHYKSENLFLPKSEIPDLN